MKKAMTVSAAALSMSLIGACGKTASRSGSSVGVNFVNLSAAIGQQEEKFFDFSTHLLSNDFSSFGVGSAGIGSAAPTSFKVAIYDLSVCEDMTVSGSGYSNATGCQALYSQTDDDAAYNSGTVPTGVNFLDLMDPTATKAKIQAFGAQVPAGTYKYGKINAYRLMKVTGSVVLDNSAGTAYTKADASNANPSDLNSSKNISTTMGTGPAAEASVVWNQNGYFKFQTPWVFDGTSAVDVDIVFNPDNILKGSAACSNCIIQENNAGTGKGISIPILKLTPVVRKSTEVSQRERYKFSSGNLNGDLTIDLYSIKGDTNRTIYGVDVRMGYNAAQTDGGLMDPMSANEVTVSGTTVTLKDWSGATIASFDRGTADGTITGTPTIACGPGVCQSAAGGVGNATGVTSYTLTTTELK